MLTKLSMVSVLFFAVFGFTGVLGGDPTVTVPLTVLSLITALVLAGISDYRASERTPNSPKRSLRTSPYPSRHHGDGADSDELDGMDPGDYYNGPGGYNASGGYRSGREGR